MKSLIFITGMILFIPVAICAQTDSFSMPQMSDAPSVSSPSMPAMSSFPVLSSQQAPSPAQAAQNTSTGSASTAASTTTSSASAESGSSQYVTAANLASLSSLSSSILGADSSSSGTDLLTSLLSGSTGTNTSSNMNNTTTNVLLEQILARLEALELQTNQSATTKTPEIATVKGAKIIRCTVNGYNVLETCRTIYSSAKAADGSFLITGDRKYLSNYKTRDETFYFLLKKLSPSSYDLAVSVLQDYTNEYSFLYQLAQRGVLQAKATGNLLSVKVDEPNWKFDMLIDIADLEG